MREKKETRGRGNTNPDNQKLKKKKREEGKVRKECCKSFWEGGGIYQALRTPLE